MRSVLLVLLVACGSPTEPSQDASSTPSVSARIVSSTVVHQVQSGAPIPITPVSDGDTLAVAIVWDGPRLGVERIDIDGLRPWTEALDNDSCASMQLWTTGYGSRNSELRGRDHVTLTFLEPAPTAPTVYIVEIVGSVGSTLSSGSTNVLSDVETGDLILSGIVSCNAIQGIASSSPFTSLGAQPFADLAYYVAQAPGSYGGAWTVAGERRQQITTSFETR